MKRGQGQQSTGARRADTSLSCNLAVAAALQDEDLEDHESAFDLSGMEDLTAEIEASLRL